MEALFHQELPQGGIALSDYLDWPGVAQVGKIESVVEQDGTVSSRRNASQVGKLFAKLGIFKK
jgi:hypothetical protein